MKIYVDLVLFLNFGFDILLIFSTALLLRRRTDLFRILLSSAVGSITIFSMFIRMSSFSLFLIKVFISVLMVLIAFGYKNMKYTLNNLFYLYTSSIILGGFLYLLSLEFSYKNSGLVFYFNGLSVNFVVLIVISPIIIWAYVHQGLKLKNVYSNYYNISLFIKDNHVIETVAFLDTGNKLMDPYMRRPIILLNRDLLDIPSSYDKQVLVPYDSLNNHGILRCIIPDAIFIEGVGMRRNFLVGIVDDVIKMEGVSCIMNPNLIERGSL